MIHSSYLGDKIKQADVILLGYPLMLDMDPAVRKNDLTIYQNVTSVSGPAMTWSMHAIGWLDVNDELSAKEMFQRNYIYIQQPFDVDF